MIPAELIPNRTSPIRGSWLAVALGVLVFTSVLACYILTDSGKESVTVTVRGK